MWHAGKIVIMKNIKSLYKISWKPIAVLVIFSILIAVYYWFDPSKEFFFIGCPLKSLTGLECAGCGVQRAFHELLHGNWRSAFLLNPLFILLLPVLILFILTSFFRSHPLVNHLYGIFFGRKALFVLIVIILVFSLFRNTAAYHAIF